MPRYFFHTRIAGDLIVDKQGVELRDPDHAWELARAMIADLVSKGADARLLSATLEVADEADEIVLEFPFSEVISSGSGQH